MKKLTFALVMLLIALNPFAYTTAEPNETTKPLNYAWTDPAVFDNLGRQIEIRNNQLFDKFSNPIIGSDAYPCFFIDNAFYNYKGEKMTVDSEKRLTDTDGRIARNIDDYLFGGGFDCRIFPILSNKTLDATAKMPVFISKRGTDTVTTEFKNFNGEIVPNNLFFYNQIQYKDTEGNAVSVWQTTAIILAIAVFVLLVFLVLICAKLQKHAKALTAEQKYAAAPKDYGNLT